MEEQQGRSPFDWSVDEVQTALSQAAGLAELLLPEAAPILREVPQLSDLWAEVSATAESAAASGQEEDLPYDAWLAFSERGEREPYQTPYFARRTRLIALGLATVFGDDTYLPALERMLITVCDEPTWALPAHVDDPTTMDHRDTVDLFAAETGQTLAEIRSLLGERLSPHVSERVRAEVTERILDPMLPGTPARWWETAPMNWAAVCAGSVLVAALHLETDPARRAGIIQRCLGALDQFLDGFGDDGCCAEGLAYWSYGFGYFTVAADLLERATRGMIRIADDPRAVRAAAYGQRADIGPERTLTYSDVGPGRPNSSIPVWWARRGVPPISALRLSLPSDDPCGRWALILRTVLWSDPLPRTAPDHADVFDSSGLVVVNRGPNALCIKGGHNDEPHNHLDLGHVSVWSDTDEVLADIGSGVYTAAYFRSGRYDFLHPSARAHNGPIIERDGKRYEQVLGESAAATLVVEVDDDLRGRAELDLTAAYDPGLGSRVRRTVTWALGADRATVVIADEYSVDEATAVVSFMTRLMPTVDGRTVIWPETLLDATLTVPDDAEVAVIQEPTFDHGGNPVSWWRIETRTPTTSGVPIQYRLALAPLPTARNPLETVSPSA